MESGQDQSEIIEKMKELLEKLRDYIVDESLVEEITYVLGRDTEVNLLQILL